MMIAAMHVNVMNGSSCVQSTVTTLASNDCKATPCEFGVCPEIDTVTSDCKCHRSQAVKTEVFRCNSEWQAVCVVG